MRSGVIIAIIVVMVSLVELTITPGFAMVISEGDSTATVSAGCPCSGACGTPTVVPSPVPQSIDNGISTADEPAGVADNSGSNAGQPASPSAPEATVPAATNQQVGTSEIPASTVEQPVSTTTTSQNTAGEPKAAGFPSLLGSNFMGTGESSPLKLKSFTPSWLKTGETASAKLFDSQGTNMINRFESPRFRFTEWPAVQKGNAWTVGTGSYS